MILNNELAHKIDRIEQLLKKLLIESQTFDSKELKKFIDSFTASYKSFKSKLSNNEKPTSIIESAIGSCKRAKSIAEKILEKDDLKDHAKEIANILVSESDKIQGELSGYYLFESPFEFSESRDLSLTEINIKIDDLYQKMNAATSQNNQALSDIEERISDIRGELSSISSTTDKMKSVLEETFENADKFIEQSIKSLKEKEVKAEELLELISRDTISGSYQQSAAAERKVANVLRGLSLFFMILMTVVMGITMWESVNDTITIQDSIFRIAIVMILSIPAAYLAKESSRHRMLETNHHRVSLELKSVDPYLSSLPEEKRNEIKERLANKIFMGSRAIESEDQKIPISSHEFIEKLLEKINKK
ncbi:hypothetical protein SAMN04487880_3634 [Marinobacter sp. es.042]|uniref:hypothetical protein n=1 Tax=Marinobacter sp. es.042 TaxID=1761794 RepID=UPI000B512482|nr:hypothetical protein [Marinobacter sp. es.042]SNB59430.1 hypothetical protein SAMN04487880_3634 [Marinobacter sp. es.042]